MQFIDPAVIYEGLAQSKRPAPTLPERSEKEPPKDPMPARRGMRAAPIDTRSRSFCTVTQGQHMITDAITTYLADPMPSQMLLIAAPAGVGKTTIGVRTAETAAAGGQKVMYVGPRKEFFADVMRFAAYPQW